MDESVKKEPVHKNIMATSNDYVDNDMSGQDEAMTVAVDKRKFLLKRLLEDEGIILSSDEDQSIDVLFM